jgi:hypothetical protein
MCVGTYSMHMLEWEAWRSKLLGDTFRNPCLKAPVGPTIVRNCFFLIQYLCHKLTTTYLHTCLISMLTGATDRFNWQVQLLSGQTGSDTQRYPSNATKPDCQMVYFKTKNLSLDKFCRALDWKILIQFMAIWNILQIIYGGILWPFGIFCVHLIHFLRFWYRAPRKIWQPCHKGAENHGCF